MHTHTALSKWLSTLHHLYLLCGDFFYAESKLCGISFECTESQLRGRLHGTGHWRRESSSTDSKRKKLKNRSTVKITGRPSYYSAAPAKRTYSVHLGVSGLNKLYFVHVPRASLRYSTAGTSLMPHSLRRCLPTAKKLATTKLWDRNVDLSKVRLCQVPCA